MKTQAIYICANCRDIAGLHDLRWSVINHGTHTEIVRVKHSGLFCKRACATVHAGQLEVE